MTNFIEEQGMEIIFVKIDSHTGDIYNEITDNYAKVAAGLTVTSAVDKWLGDNDLKVKDEHVRNQVYQVLHEKKLISLVNPIIEEDCNKGEKILSEDNILDVISCLKSLLINDPEDAKDFLMKLSVDKKEKIILELI